jgi:hypothetical protein
MAPVLIERGLLPAILTACNDTDAEVVQCGINTLNDCVNAATREESADLRPIVLHACAAAAFPSASFSRLVSVGHLPHHFPELILAVRWLLQWTDCAVDNARLHPLAQRLVDAGLLPHIEGQSHKRE